MERLPRREGQEVETPLATRAWVRDKRFLVFRLEGLVESSPPPSSSSQNRRSCALGLPHAHQHPITHTPRCFRTALATLALVSGMPVAWRHKDGPKHTCATATATATDTSPRCGSRPRRLPNSPAACSRTSARQLTRTLPDGGQLAIPNVRVRDYNLPYMSFLQWRQTHETDASDTHDVAAKCFAWIHSGLFDRPETGYWYGMLSAVHLDLTSEEQLRMENERASKRVSEVFTRVLQHEFRVQKDEFARLRALGDILAEGEEDGGRRLLKHYPQLKQ
ncbi:hypothetical protein DFH27DRAFT_629747 [Peziza echinospora]|nr:hypothetical protein DFH27DRAFT_629747 [Peziza echinospora]